VYTVQLTVQCILFLQGTAVTGQAHNRSEQTHSVNIRTVYSRSESRTRLPVVAWEPGLPRLAHPTVRSSLAAQTLCSVINTPYQRSLQQNPPTHQSESIFLNLEHSNNNKVLLPATPTMMTPISPTESSSRRGRLVPGPTGNTGTGGDLRPGCK
jgi:hypothetical protein